MKIGRNAPCPCGSGKKYKTCCLAKEGVSLDLHWRRLNQAHDRLVDRLMVYALEQFGDSALADAMEEFFPLPVDAFDEAALERHAQTFYPWYLFNWIVYPADMDFDPELPLDKTIAEIYALKRPQELNPIEKRLIAAAAGQPYSFYEVMTCEPGKGYQLRDVLSGNTFDVLEKSGSEIARAGDILYCRIVRDENVAMVVGSGSILIPPGEKTILVQFRKWLKKMHRRIDATTLIEFEGDARDLYFKIYQRLTQPPELQNTDGDPLCFHTLYFEIDSPQIAFERLCSLSVTASEEEMLAEAEFDADGQIVRVEIPWSRKGHKKVKSLDNTILGRIEIRGHRLKVEVNSARRAQRARKLIYKQLGRHVSYRTMEIKSVESMFDRAAEGGSMSRRLPDGSIDLADQPELREHMAEMIRAHWNEWLGQKIPALEGKSPRQAVQSAGGRESVEALLLDAERHARKDSQMSSIQLGAIAEVRRSLKLDKPPETRDQTPPASTSASARIASIRERIEAFGHSKLDRTHTDLALKLCDKIGRMRNLDITRGREEIWAASIVHAIARLNFLFDPDNDIRISVDDLCRFFGTKKTTIGNKAGHILDTCDLYHGDPDFCTPRIAGMFQVYETEEGFLMPASLLDTSEKPREVIDRLPFSKKIDPGKIAGQDQAQEKPGPKPDDRQLKLFDDGA